MAAIGRRRAARFSAIRTPTPSLLSKLWAKVLLYRDRTKIRSIKSPHMFFLSSLQILLYMLCSPIHEIDVEKGMLVERLRREWLDLERAVPIIPALDFTPEGLAMGANTVLVPADGDRSLNFLEDGEARLQTLLSVAYGRAMAPATIGKIDRAAKCWARGDDCLALIHLALAGLHRVEDRRGWAVP